MFTNLLRQIIIAEQTVSKGGDDQAQVQLINRLQGTQIRLATKVACQFWLDNQCFEAQVMALKNEYQSAQSILLN